ncbi:tetratricopeptide repeat protein 37 [Aricia agestis]|uniref:tetratricopeptide repeat protein 37 n=1 Tax=Aricia agestis TaxID=91739 RepID=UPI001C20B5C6|nr:tetratricopeptide repeat protein 37 [Aricia agestis]
MTDVKSLLKEARTHIDAKKFKEAQEVCKGILKKDKQNYLALVLLGKSFQDSDQAPLAYQKAIATKPDQLLAWQGLANYYECKEGNIKHKLFTIYDEILKLQIDTDKATEILNKLCQLGCSLKCDEAFHVTLNFIDRKPDDLLQKIAEKHLIELVNAEIPCKENDIPRVIKCLQEIDNHEDANNLYILQAKVIINNRGFAEAITEILGQDFFKTSVTFRDWLCKYLCVYFVKHDSFSGFIIEENFNQIISGIENSKYPGLLKSIVSYSKGSYIDAYKECVPLINFHEPDATEAAFVIKCTVMLKKWPVTQKLATSFLTKARNSEFIITLQKYLFLSLKEQQKWQEAIAVAKKIPTESLSTEEQAALARCYIETNENAEHVLKNLESSDHHTQLEVLALAKQNKHNEILKLLENAPDDSFNLFYKGKSYWEINEYEKSIIYLLRAAKLDAEHDQTFHYLGKYYHQIKNDLEKSKKCLEKAYSLNNSNSDIIKDLSNIYNKLNQKDADFELLINSSQTIQGETWNSFRLGLHYLNRREWENAIAKFRDVIKINQSHVLAFECLADAYFSRGSFTSALKAYNKVISMDPSKSVHCLTRIGFIHSLLTQYEDALSTFTKVFEIDSSSILALKGIAETWMRIAKKNLEAKLYGKARDTAQNAITYITKALSMEKKFKCFWNLLAEAFLFIAKLPKAYSFVHTKPIGGDTDEIVRKDNIEIFPQALACYSVIAKRRNQLTTYDLAHAYLSYYHATKDIANCHIAYRLIIAEIKAKPTTWRNWNLLGKICIFLKKYDKAQHCFIKALLTTRKWSVAKIWCNLGTLYVCMQQYKIANYCFWRGQSTLPSYPQSWIGQALIAEVIREEEAMDLLRHACRLGYHPESALGYADWVCRTLKNIDYKNNPDTKYIIDGLYAIPYSVDLLSWYLKFEPDNACANNMLGIMQERTGLLRSSLDSYTKALELAENTEQKNIILLNVGRVLLRLENYDEAITTYKAITEASLNSTCGLALALFKNGLYEESYSVYDTALHWLCNAEEEKSDLLVAMAGIVYKFKGMEDAKTLLFHSIQVSQKNPTPYCLFAICSLGIMHSDTSLSRLALGELAKYEKENSFGYDIGFLKSFLVLEEDQEQAIKILSNFLLEHPGNSLLWFCMAQYCLRMSNKVKTASSCAQRALCSANYEDCTLSAKMLATASVAEQMSGDINRASLLGRKGVHMYPFHSEIWAALLFSIITDKNSPDKKFWILRTTTRMRKHLHVARSLSRWINLIEKKLVKLGS